MASPTPHRMALCALARYLGTSRPLDAEASELRVREPPPSCVRNLSESDWRLLSLVLMREATATERGREPSMRAFHATLDRISQAHGAPPAEPFPPPPDLEAATEARVARSPVVETRARTRTPGEISPAESFLERRLAECHALLRDAPPANLADVLVEACGSLRDVDDLERLFRDVEPRSAHAAEMRGGADEEKSAPWPSPVDADSAVGLFLRQCVADFAAAPFERACALAQAMDAYRREGHGEYDEVNDASVIQNDAVDGDAAKNGAKKNAPETLLRADARWDAAEAAAERADAAAERKRALFSSSFDDGDDEGDASFFFDDDAETNAIAIATPRRDGLKISAAQFRECFSSLVYVSRDGRGGSAPYAFAPPADPRAFLERVSKPSRAAEAERVRTAMLRADAGESVFREGSAERELENVEGLENVFGAHFLAHLDAARRRDFESAEAHLRRHFDYVDPTSVSFLNGSTHHRERERERETSLRAVGGFFPPENPAFFSGAVTAAGDAAGDATGAGQRRSRWRLHAAALSLARAHVNAARADEALKALNETVRVAQQNGDTGALANAVAALCALSASSAAPVASREGVPAGRAYSSDDARLNDDDVNDAERARAESEDHRVLLQRLVAQARALKDPTLLAFADIANARRRAATPAAGARRAPETRGSRETTMIAGFNHAKGAGSGSAGSAFATAAARARAVRVSPPATAAAAARRVEELRHHAALGAAAPVSSSSSFGVSEDATGSFGAAGETAKTTPTSFYPPPRGLSAASLADVAASASVSQLAGSASALAAAVWEAHGVAEPARLCALKHVRLDASKCAAALPSTDEFSVFSDRGVSSDGGRTRLEVTSVSAAAVDTATALAQLARHAAREHGPKAAADVLEVASRRFPGFGTSGEGGGVPPDEEEDGDGETLEKTNNATKAKTVLRVPAAYSSPAAAAAAASAACETRLMACIARESYHDARACVSALAALAPALSCWDPETRVEAFRAGAHVKLVSRDLVGAHDDAVSCAAAARRLETCATHKSVAASLDLADIFLKAGAFAQALPHALAAEHVAAVSELDGARAAATAAAAECLLGLDAGAGGAFAAAAAEALDAHAVGLLGKGGLAVRARARLAAGKAALATRERASFASFVRGAKQKKGETRDVAEKFAEASAGADPVMAPLASAAAAAETAGSFALEAEAHYLRAMRLNQLGDVKGRNEAARAFRRCDRAARRARRGDPGATGEETR